MGLKTIEIANELQLVQNLELSLQLLMAIPLAFNEVLKST